MECSKCGAEMKHYEFKANFTILGAEYKHPIDGRKREAHNPHSVYVCDNCGYMEFSVKECENPDI